jgi:hypothetical protein
VHIYPVSSPQQKRLIPLISGMFLKSTEEIVAAVLGVGSKGEVQAEILGEEVIVEVVVAEIM